MNISLELLKKLRQETMCGVSDCRQALEDTNGDYAKAKKLLTERAQEKAKKKADRQTAEGIIEAYIHGGGKIGVLIELKCETDFVAKNEEFKKLAHEIALQIAASSATNVKTLIKEPYIREPSLSIESLIKETVAKLGENITITRFFRMTLGE